MHPAEVLANRIVWALLLVTAVLTWQAPLGVARHGAALSRKTLLSFVASALLLSANWITYIWAVSNGHVVDSSLGYFITPLVNVALGYGLLGERPRRAQWLALAIAAAGVRLADGRGRQAAVDRPGARPDLRRLRPAAQDRGARRARRPDASRP